MAIHIRRREFIIALSGVTSALPFATHAQQPAMPVIGYLNARSRHSDARLTAAFREGLKEAGFVEGQNVVIEYRYADDQYDRLPALAADLVRRQVTAIAATGGTPLSAKAATSTIPIIFGTGGDPVKLGLVASLNRPGGNATGVNFLIAELGSKQLGLLHELVPTAARIGFLSNPGSLVYDAMTRDVTAAASAMGLQIDIVTASDNREIEAAFGALVRNRADALLVGADAVLFGRRLQITTLAIRHAIPALYNVREYPEAGGLMSYGTSQTEAYRQVGVYTGKILKGAKPNDLPVMQSTKLELVINLLTARALGLEIPPTLLARADEVIE